MIGGELLNLRSTSTARVLLVASMVMAAISLVANLATFETAQLAERATVQTAMHASTVATITFSFVAGLVLSTSDYRFGRIDQLLLSTQSPSRILATKSAVGFGLGVVYGVLGSVVAVAVSTLYYRVNDAEIDLTSATVIRPLVGVTVAAGLFVVAGLGLGSLIRNQPFALGAGLVLVLVVQPPLLLGAPTVGRWFPGAAGLALTLAPDSAMLGQVAGGLVLLGWTAVAVLAGVLRLQRTGA